MKRVLIPVDGSPCSLRAVELMASKRAYYAEPDDLELHLVYVQSTRSADAPRQAGHAPAAGYRHEDSDRALRDARVLLDRAGARYSVHEGFGNAAEVVAQLAGSLHCDQITMGTRGRSALADLLMGSTTLKVIQLAQVPVLLVK
jgi:nucleotide-binding universal stress UspA family protein